MDKPANTLVNRSSAHVLRKGIVGYPAILSERLGTAAPATLSALGNLDLLSLPKTALFCSARCPGSAILAAYDQAARWRDEGRCIISGFHSPVAATSSLPPSLTKPTSPTSPPAERWRDSRNGSPNGR